MSALRSLETVIIESNIEWEREKEWREKEAAKSDRVRLLELLELQQRIIERIIDICKRSEQL